MPSGVYEHKKGWHHTKETKIKIAESNLGQIRSEETREKQRQLKLKNPTRYWLGKKRVNMLGEKHPLWNGGNSKGYRKGYRDSLDYKDWRKSVFKRDKYTCQKCGISGVYITAHHIKSWAHYPELRLDLNNGITLCEDCHKKTDNYKGRSRGKAIKQLTQEFILLATAN